MNGKREREREGEGSRSNPNTTGFGDSKQTSREKTSIRSFGKRTPCISSRFHCVCFRFHDDSCHKCFSQGSRLTQFASGNFLASTIHGTDLQHFKE